MGSLTLREVCKSFDRQPVLNQINLDVEDGEFIVIVGPSGCGKSTLLRIIAGLEDATSGEIELAGENVTRTPPAKRGLAMVFQTYALYPHLNVLNNMTLALKQSGTPAAVISQRTTDAAEMLALDQLLDRRPAELSGGQRQRVAIARAIVREPKLLLFDEPLSNLDATLRAQTRVEIARLHRKLGATIVYVTHDQVEAMTLADRIVALNKGKIEQVGSPMELYRAPANQFVAGFIGSPRINFLEVAKLPTTNDYSGAHTIGIRPEHITLNDQSGDLTGTVSHVENLGGDTRVFLDCDHAGTITVRLFGDHDVKIGSTCKAVFDQEQIHRFDNTGQTER